MGLFQWQTITQIDLLTWKGKKMKYIVWVGGVPDYEGNSNKEAKRVQDFWISKGYQDVILEIVNEG